MKGKAYLIVVALVCICMTGCYSSYTPRTVQTLDTVMTSGRMEYYGAYYKQIGVPYDVISLDLYSKGLGLNDEGKMEGVGTNLYISDIFVPTTDGTLPAGTYLSDTTANEMHFLRGLDYDGSYGGSYVLLMSESGYKVLPITDGEMTVAYVGDTLVLDGSAKLRNTRQPYHFHYRNVLPTVRR